MGRPKATLDFAGVPLIERIVAELRKSFTEIVIVAAPESADAARFDLAGVKVIRDETAFGGPLVALAHGLESVGVANEHQIDAVFACSCDLPLIRAEVAALLVGMIADYDAVIPEVGGRLQPLHAVYRKREAAAAMRALAARGETRLVAIVDAIRTRRVGEEGLRGIDPELRSFFNLNTAADYAEALRLLRAAR
jgi:molybdopterin-guanine dinucleotide biosynthesis protein A